MDKAVHDDPLYDFQLLKRRRLLYEVETLEELADCIDVPLDVLSETITTYNDGIKNGAESEFLTVNRSHIITEHQLRSKKRHSMRLNQPLRC